MKRQIIIDTIHIEILKEFKEIKELKKCFTWAELILANMGYSQEVPGLGWNYLDVLN